jgi:NAD(P)-dependent dehydrogenase (short-subunit alcohol dehydrogenase family)
VENSGDPAVNPLLIRGRTVPVTGASSGIGRETATLLSQLKARVLFVGWARREKAGRNEGKHVGADHFVQPTDSTKSDLIPGWLRQIAAEQALWLAIEYQLIASLRDEIWSAWIANLYARITRLADKE